MAKKIEFVMALVVDGEEASSKRITLEPENYNANKHKARLHASMMIASVYENEFKEEVIAKGEEVSGT